METLKTIITAIVVGLPFISHAQSAELTCWTTKGGQMKLPVENAILVMPDTIAAIDLCGVEAIALDCSSANPNCLYYTDGATSVEGLPNANVVCEGVCEGLLLTDQACFYCPVSFFATDAMLRFTPRSDDEDQETDFSQRCHETVILPFDTDFVIPENANGPMPEGWFQKATFSGYDDGMLVFHQSFEESLMANTPYLVTFAYGAYGTRILFCGQNKTVEETKMIIEGESPYFFTGVTKSEEETSGYFRYHRGQDPYFVHTGDGKPMEPFRCFMVSPMADEREALPTSGQILRYSVSEGESTGIVPRIKNHSSQVCYDLMGRQLPNVNRNKGIYIQGGVKVIR